MSNNNSNMVSEPSNESSYPPPPSSHSPSSLPVPLATPTATPNSSANTNFGSPPTIGEKLTGKNYQIWKTQITPYLQAAGLLSVLDGSELAPPQFLPHPANSSLTEPNPLYKSWLIRDSIARGWILNSSTSSIVAQLTAHTSVAAIWIYLGDSYAAQSAARASALRLQFQSISKGHRSVTDFLHEASSIAEQLTTISEPFSSNEYHTHLFRGLGPKFAGLDTAISVLSQSGSLSRNALHGLLLQHEGRLELKQMTTHAPAVAFVGHQTTGCFSQQTTSRSSPQPRSPQSVGSHTHLGSIHPSPLLPTPLGPPNYRSSADNYRKRNFGPMCQICRRPGHRAHTCRDRFNSRVGTFPLSGHSTPQAYYIAPTSSPQSSPAVYYAPPPTPPSTLDLASWYLDSGATHHITDSIAGLSSVTPYTGPH